MEKKEPVNEPVRYKELRDGLTPILIQKDHKWLHEAVVKDAVIGLDEESGNIMFYDGFFSEGTFMGVWFGGLFGQANWQGEFWGGGYVWLYAQNDSMRIEMTIYSDYNPNTTYGLFFKSNADMQDQLEELTRSERNSSKSKFPWQCKK
jgi:hypothetical protein